MDLSPWQSEVNSENLNIFLDNWVNLWISGNLTQKGELMFILGTSWQFEFALYDKFRKIYVNFWQNLGVLRKLWQILPT